jgi:branched-chain amino acid aminotransferase
MKEIKTISAENDQTQLYREKFHSTSELVGDLYNLYAYIDGVFVKGDDVKVSIWDHSYLYGDSVFEGIRAYNGKIFKLTEHIQRLFESAKSIEITCPLSLQEMSEAVIRTFRINKIREGHGRATISRGIGRMGLDPRRCKEPSVTVLAYPFPPTYKGEAIRMITSSIRRKGPLSVDAKVKCSNYMDNILAKLQATAAGVDEAVMLDNQGYVAEATAENIFAVKNGKILTPPTTAALNGITRATIITIAEANGFEITEQDMTLHDLYTADEVFLTGTAAEIVPAKEIDGRKIGSGNLGNITAKLQGLYKRYVESEAGSPIF